MEVIVGAVAVGVAIAVLTGGTINHILDARVRWPLLVVAAVGARLLLALWSPGDGWSDPVGFGVFVATFAALAVFCLFNLHLTGMFVVLIGASLNLLVVALNGGMPVRITDDTPPDRVTAIEESVTHIPEDDADTLPVLGQIIVLPDPVDRPITFGDLVLGVGLVDVLVHASRTRKKAAPLPVASAGSAPDPVLRDEAVERGDDPGVVDVGTG